jgi:polysaccharide pyruvyl transferase WcaK-like protein
VLLHRPRCYVAYFQRNGFADRILAKTPPPPELLSSNPANNANWSIINESISSFKDVLSEIPATDVVVSARYHNTMLALMLYKPVISLSYHEKFAALVAGMGLAEFNHDIDELDVATLTEHVIQFQKRAQNVRPPIKQKVDEYRFALGEQYARIFQYGVITPSLVDAGKCGASRGIEWIV